MALSVEHSRNCSGSGLENEVNGLPGKAVLIHILPLLYFKYQTNR